MIPRLYTNTKPIVEGGTFFLDAVAPRNPLRIYVHDI